MSAADRVDHAQRRFPPLGYAIAVLYKFFDDTGNFLCAMFAYYAFVSIFPLLILATTILGVVLDGDPHLQHHLINSALSEFPIVGDQIRAPSASNGSWISIVVSALVALYGALGAAQAVQFMANSIWQVPRNARPNPFAARGKSVGLIAVFGVALFGTVGLTQVVPRVIHLAGLAKFGVQVGTLVVDVCAALVAFRLAASKRMRVLDLLPGAVFAGVMWQVLQSVGGSYVENFVQRNKSSGQLAVVVGLIIFLYIAGLMLAVAMEIDAVRLLRLWPRSLLTPFTDNVVLTQGDKRAYAGLTKATRLKGFEHIDVQFEPPEAGATSVSELQDAQRQADHEHPLLPLDFGDDAQGAGRDPDGPAVPDAPGEVREEPAGRRGPGDDSASARDGDSGGRGGRDARAGDAAVLRGESSGRGVRDARGADAAVLRGESGGRGARDVGDSGPSPDRVAATEPMPTRGGTGSNAHRLPGVAPDAHPDEDEPTIPIVRQPAAVDEADHSDASGEPTEQDPEDAAPVIRGPWSAGR